jgi:hypothetical protein
MQPVDFKPNHVIIKEGDFGDRAFVIEGVYFEGSVQEII